MRIIPYPSHAAPRHRHITARDVTTRGNGDPQRTPELSGVGDTEKAAPSNLHAEHNGCNIPREARTDTIGSIRNSTEGGIETAPRPACSNGQARCNIYQQKPDYTQLYIHKLNTETNIKEHTTGRTVNVPDGVRVNSPEGRYNMADTPQPAHTSLNISLLPYSLLPLLTRYKSSHTPPTAIHRATNTNTPSQNTTTNQKTPYHTHDAATGGIHMHRYRPPAHLPIHPTRPSPATAEIPPQTLYTSHTTTPIQLIPIHSHTLGITHQHTHTNQHMTNPVKPTMIIHMSNHSRSTCDKAHNHPHIPHIPTPTGHKTPPHPGLHS